MVVLVVAAVAIVVAFVFVAVVVLVLVFAHGCDRLIHVAFAEAVVSSALCK